MRKDLNKQNKKSKKSIKVWEKNLQKKNKK